LVSAQEMTKDELVAAYEKSFAKLQSWDITYAVGNVVNWDDWQSTSQQQFRWRKSGDVERKDMTEHMGYAAIIGLTAEDAKTYVPRQQYIRPSVHYTDGTNLWRLHGNPDKIEGITVFDQKGMHAEIHHSLARRSILSGFPYLTFEFAQFLDKQAFLLDEFTYSIPQILKEFRTEIIARKQNGNDIIITTRSYSPNEEADSRYFVQISFDSSVGYFPRQIVLPLGVPQFADGTVGDVFNYSVRDFVEYHTSADGAFFPVKKKLGVTSDINKLDGLEVTGRLAVSSITVNQPVDVPSVEIPPGVVVAVVEKVGEERKTTSYIWGEDNKPLKVLTQADYDAAEREQE